MALSVPVVALHGYGAPVVRQSPFARALCDRIGPTPHDRADQQAREGLVRARQLNHPPTLAFCLGLVATVYKLRSEVIRVEECSREQLSVAGEHELPWWRAGAMFNLAWVQVRKGNVRAGIADMEHVFELDQRVGADVLAPLSLAQLAEAYGLVGDLDRALALVEQAMEFASQPGAGLYLADLYRIRAQLTLKRRPADRSRSMQDLERAITSARERSMTVVELWAAIEFAPLLAEVG